MSDDPSVRYLGDASAVGRRSKPSVADVLVPLVQARRLALCGPTVVELLRSTRAGVVGDVASSLAGFPNVPVTEAIARRAIEVVTLLARKGTHVAPSVADLLVAGTAEAHGLHVLHYDADFDLIAGVTGQPTRWIVPRGSAD